MRARAWVAALALVAGACASSPRVATLELERWIELRTPLFSIVTHVSREEARHQANQLISFTEVLREQMQAGQVDPALPLRIYIFAGWEQYLNFAPRGAEGYTLPRLQGSLLVLSLQHPAGSKETLFHEYVHYLLFNQQRVAYPLWYNEGLAEFLGSTMIRDDVALIGALPSRFPVLDEGRVTPLERLLGGGLAGLDGRAINHYYADAWLLVHYLHFSRQLGGPERLQPALGYLARLNRGVSWREAFAQAFALEPEALERELDAHLERLGDEVPGFSLTLDAPRPEIRERALSRGEAAALLAELGLSIGNTPLARALAREALRSDPADARALALSAEAAAAAGSFAEADQASERAISLAPAAVWAHEARGDVWAALAEREPDAAEAHLAQARESYRRATELSPDLPSTWAGLGRTYLGASECEQLVLGIQALESAHRIAPWDAALNLHLGQMYARAGRLELAKEKLRFVTSLSQQPELLRDAEESLREVEAAPKPPC